MSKMKTEFELETIRGEKKGGFVDVLDYVGRPYLRISFDNGPIRLLPTKDLERFAVNILKTLKSKKLK